MKHSLVCLLIFVCAVFASDARTPVISPDGRFEAYTFPSEPDGTGAKLFVRAKGSAGQGILLCENGRWIAAKWSPDSRFLGVEDYNDGHVSDVFIYRIAPAKTPDGLTTTLRYRSPEPGTYDTKWTVTGWDASRARATLTRTTLESRRRWMVSIAKDVAR